jgi:hypothetical protein
MRPEDAWLRAHSRKTELYRALDDHINRKDLTELHTHLMGMGSADFWVSKIMETFLPRKESMPKSKKVVYPLEKILEASGFSCSKGFNGEIQESLAESIFFDSFPSYTLNDVVDEASNTISNEKIVNMLQYEDGQTNRSGPFRALVRNWFEFAGSDGQGAAHTEVLHQCTFACNRWARALYVLDFTAHHRLYRSRVF